MEGAAFLGEVVFRWGPVEIHRSVVFTWFLMAVLILASWVLTRRLALKPRGAQALLEGVAAVFEDAIGAVLPEQVPLVFPFLATLWIFVGLANLTGLIPGLASPTSDLSVTAALAVLVFLSVHGFGIRAEGLKHYLAHYVRPNPFLLPFHVISEISRTLALAVRLFGNIMSLEMAAFLVLLVAGLLVPIPILMLHIIEAVIQAYLFGMLALIYIAGGIQSHELKTKKNKEGTHE